MSSESLRLEGNECFLSQQYEEAIEHYSASIELDRDNTRSISNRA